MKIDLEKYRRKAKQAIKDFDTLLENDTMFFNSGKTTDDIILNIYEELVSNIEYLVNITDGVPDRGFVIFLEDNSMYVVYLTENDMILYMNYDEVLEFVKLEIELNRMIKNTLQVTKSVLN